jgi:hypothetical protein
MGFWRSPALKRRKYDIALHTALYNTIHKG